MTTCKTSCLILRQTPFQESGKILACISPDFGRLDFLVKGASSLGPKRFPKTGLFRELSLEFKAPERSGVLLSMRNQELLTSFDAIALNTEHYLAVCSLARFLLSNTKPMLEIPQTYAAVKHFLTELTVTGNPVEPMLTLTYLAFLDESGLIPDPETAERAAALDKILEAAQGGPLPVYPAAYWEKLRLWCMALLKHNRINLSLS